MNQKRPGSETDNRAYDETIAPEAAGDTNSDGDFAAESISQTLGRYQIKELLGRGGMGAVYLAHDSQLDRDVALKVPKFDANTNPNLITRFYREARSAANLAHPNLCQVFDVGEIDGTHYIAMAFIKGRPLSSYVNPEKPSAPRAIATIIRKVALAMEDAHQSGIIHRDLKPANIMIDHRREPIVMDFGLAVPQDLGDESRLTQDGALLGSPAYMSPEQLKGKSDAIGPASDVYALGIVLYELLAGRLPYAGAGSTIAMIGQILTEDPIPLSSVRGDIDPPLAALCEKAMSKDPDTRFASMKEFAAALGKFLQSASGDKRLAEPAKTGTVTVSQIQLTEQSKLAKTMCESGQFVAAVSILKQIIANPEAKGSKMHPWAQSMLTKAEGQIAQQAQPASTPVTAATPTAQDNLFAELPSMPAPAAPAAANPYRRPSQQKPKSQPIPPAALIGIAAAVLLIGGGAVAYYLMSDPPTYNPVVEPAKASDNAVSSASDDSATASQTMQTDDALAKELLGRFDRNRDGYLDDTEIPPPEVDAMMNADTNQDRKLSQQELAKLDRRDLPDDDPNGFEPRPFDGQRPPKVINVEEFDLDGDGRVSLSDIPGPRREFLSRADTNDDGILDEKEIENLKREAQRRRPGGPRGDSGDRPFRPAGRPGN